MATTQLTYSSLVPNGNLLQPAGTTLVAAPTNNMQLASAFPELTVLKVSNTDGAAALTVTVKAGQTPPALAAGQGDLAVVVAFGTTQFLGPFESGRFVRSDGSMLIESTTVTGTITALRVPRNT
jgi:hypothetical protein